MNKDSTFFVAIDTSYSFASIALFDRETVCYHHIIPEKHSHTKSLPLALKAGWDSLGISAKDIACIGINQGPGSFTGLRVGASLVKGLCFSQDIPLIAIDGPQAYADHLYETHRETYTDVFLLLNARKNNYYFASRRHQDEEASPSQFASMDEIQRQIDLCERPLVYINEDQMTPSKVMHAVHFEKTLRRRFDRQQFTDILTFEPNYLINNYQKKA
jgi:tRNA threonylcarbamoyladenosine biosynthesis protein TsaB